MDNQTKNRPPFADWTPPITPDTPVLDGQYVRMEQLSADAHGADIHSANMQSENGAIWNYLPYGPFPSLAGYHRWIRDTAESQNPYFYAIKNKEIDQWCGVASYLNIKAHDGSIEVGHVNFSPALQRTRAATEAVYLMMQWAFESGYRRFEWKCNAANMGSRRAAQRLGLSFEGVFRQATIVKGHNRDTAWFAAIDSEWPALQAAFQAWLSQDNFDENGQQIERLADLTDLVRAASDPVLSDL